MPNKISCPICKKSKFRNILNIKKFPYFTAPINKETIKKNKINNKVCNLNVINCKNCTHTFLSKLPNLDILNDLYNKYYNYPSALNGFFKPERDENFIKSFLKNQKVIKNKKILEVGCYDGYVLKRLKKFGCTVIGCDPSKGALIGKRHGIKIRKEFFNPKKINYGHFDYVITRHLIEHIVDPLEWIKRLTSVLNKKGKLIVETPNVEFFLRRGLPSVFSLQHLHYFSKNSIIYLFKLANIKIEKIEENKENLIIFAQKSKNLKIKNKIFKNKFNSYLKFQNKYNKTKKIIETIFKIKNKIKTKKIAIWGAGGFGSVIDLFYKLPRNKISYFIDSDIKKTKMKFLNKSANIIYSNNIDKIELNIVIIASMYGNQITNQIKNKKVNLKVLNLFPDIKILNIRN